MAVNDYATSEERGQPVELFKFIYGTETGREHRYTSAERDVDYDGDTYTALPVLRDAIKTKGRGESNEVTIEVPKTSEVAELFRIFPPGRPVSIIIREGHIANDGDPTAWVDDEFNVIFTGRVLQSNRKKNTVVLTCESAAAGMKRVGLRRHYQWPCPLVLYGTRCGADKDAAEVTGTVASISGNVVTLDAGWEGAMEPTDFLAGLFEWDSADGREYRTILGISGDEITLNATTGELAATDEVNLYLGCPHTLDGCRNLHDNIVNYGGHPFIPLVNPVGKNNHT